MFMLVETCCMDLACSYEFTMGIKHEDHTDAELCEVLYEAEAMFCPFCCNELRIIRTEQKNDEPPELDEIERLLKTGNRLHAIKAYRAYKGTTLSETRSAINNFQDTGVWQ